MNQHKKICPNRDSIHGPHAQESSTLPTELQRQGDMIEENFLKQLTDSERFGIFKYKSRNLLPTIANDVISLNNMNVTKFVICCNDVIVSPCRVYFLIQPLVDAPTPTSAVTESTMVSMVQPKQTKVFKPIQLRKRFRIRF